MSVPYPLAEVINASGAEPDHAIWCDVDVKLTTGRIGLTGRTQATQLEYVVSPLAMSKLTNGYFLIGEINFHTPAGYVVVRSHEHQPNDRIAILYRCRSCSAKYDNDVGMLGLCRSCMVASSVAKVESWFRPVDLKAEAEANGYKESDILKLGDPTAPVDPLDVEYDGVKLRTLLDGEEFNRRELGGEYYQCWQMSRVQKDAISAHWSAQLRAKVAAAKAAERNVVTYCEEDEP